MHKVQLLYVPTSRLSSIYSICCPFPLLFITNNVRFMLTSEPKQVCYQVLYLPSAW